MYSIQKIYNKGSGKINEDEILLKDNVFGVFDGMTNLVGFVNQEGKTGGKLAVEIARQVFLEDKRPLKELAILANRQIRDGMKKAGVNLLSKEAQWSTMVAIVRIKDGEADFFQIGDCLILAIHKDGNYKLLTEYRDHDLKTMTLWKELAEKKVKNIWDRLKSQIDKVRKEANINYGCLNGDEVAVKFFNFGKIGLKNVKSLVLFTDGLIIPKENPQSAEDWSLFIETYQKTGLKGLLNYIRSLEKSDPNCWKYPRFKQHDDVAAIGIDFL